MKAFCYKIKEKLFLLFRRLQLCSFDCSLLLLSSSSKNTFFLVLWPKFPLFFFFWVIFLEGTWKRKFKNILFFLRIFLKKVKNVDLFYVRTRQFFSFSLLSGKRFFLSFHFFEFFGTASRLIPFLETLTLVFEENIGK